MALYKLHFQSPTPSFNFSLSSKLNKPYLKPNEHQSAVHGGIICSSSKGKPRKKGRLSRATMSDEDLCKELREIMLEADLPADRVPLMKELCEHGRKDLANIVRRKGYKVVSMLLSTYGLSVNHKENSFVEYPQRSDPHGDEASEFEETRLASAESSPSLRKSSLVDVTAETNGSVQIDMPVRIGEPSKSSIGTVNSVASYSYQKSESDMNVYGTSQPFHALEEQLLGSDRIINQAKDIEANEVFAEDNSKTEIDHLKALLHQKEMELAELKELTEKEKQALTLLQAKAQSEIGNVHRVILAKDAELRASTDKLSGLKEVQIQFCVNGETIELAGSFNGWHKHIKMNLHPSFRTVDSQDCRVSKLWSTILWLYPGTYEIKFIVDGQWMIDPQREFVSHGHITNNILRVDR